MKRLIKFLSIISMFCFGSLAFNSTSAVHPAGSPDQIAKRFLQQCQENRQQQRRQQQQRQPRINLAVHTGLSIPDVLLTTLPNQ